MQCMTHRHGRAFVPAIHDFSEALHRDVDARIEVRGMTKNCLTYLAHRRGRCGSARGSGPWTCSD